MLNITTLLLAGGSVLTPVGFVALPCATPLVVVTRASDAVTGTVHSVDWEASSFVLRVGEGEEAQRTVPWNAETVFLLDGENSTAREVLVADGKVNVSLGEDGLATSVSRWSE